MSTFNLKVGAAVGALVLAAILVPTFERPPVQTTQGGFRGTSMGTVVNPRLRATTVAASQVPEAPEDAPVVSSVRGTSKAPSRAAQESLG